MKTKDLLTPSTTAIPNKRLRVAPEQTDAMGRPGPADLTGMYKEIDRRLHRIEVAAALLLRLAQGRVNLDKDVAVQIQLAVEALDSSADFWPGRKV
jgi:hypothetical protein